MSNLPCIMIAKAAVKDNVNLVLEAQGRGPGRFWMQMRTNGQLGGGVGNQNSVVIVGGTSNAGLVTTGVLTFDGANVVLYRNGVSVYSGAQSGVPDTTTPLALGGLNNNGTVGFFAPADMFNALAINRALTPAEIVNLTNSWGTT
jgi:hypothetical protein